MAAQAVAGHGYDDTRIRARLADTPIRIVERVVTFSTQCFFITTGLLALPAFGVDIGGGLRPLPASSQTSCRGYTYFLYHPQASSVQREH